MIRELCPRDDRNVARTSLTNRALRIKKVATTMTSSLGGVSSHIVDHPRGLLRMGANVLLTGSDHALNTFVTDARSDLRQPLVWTSPTSRLPTQPPGTLIVIDVDRLDAAGQRALAEWIDGLSQAPTQIISLATRPLFPRVRDGLFDERLYYRLNTIHFDLSSTEQSRTATG